MVWRENGLGEKGIKQILLMYKQMMIIETTSFDWWGDERQHQCLKRKIACEFYRSGVEVRKE